jgi:signal transduction histidine kinase/DNA-binding NarL/FixJ family response regulator
VSEGGRILIVDDEPANRRLLEAILVPEGYSVSQAENGDQALGLIAAGEADLVLLDVMMPGIDGIEVCRRVRGDLQLPLLPVIMVTALTDRDSRTRGKDAGADEFLTKPVFEEELLARVRNLFSTQRYYRLAAQERARAEAEARRWKLVSDVACAVDSCRDYASLEQSLKVLLADALPVEDFHFFELDGAGSRAPCSIRTSRLLCVSASACPDPYAAVLGTSGCADGALLPVSIGGALQGMLLASCRRALSAEEQALLEGLVPHLGNAVANVRSHIKAQQLSECRDRLSMLLVHDLKNPLCVISLNLESLVDPKVAKEERDEAFDETRSAADRLLKMITDLLDIGRAEDGDLRVIREPVRVHEFLRGILSGYTKVAAGRGISLRCTGDLDVTAELDRGLLTRAVENIVGNALRYAPPHGHIGVRVGAERGGVLIELANDGPPIAANMRECIFEKYGTGLERHGASNRGLGLYLCRLVIEAHGGTIAVRSGVADGVCFSIWLPGPGSADLAR